MYGERRREGEGEEGIDVGWYLYCLLCWVDVVVLGMMLYYSTTLLLVSCCSVHSHETL